jgi:hypothetical protein
MRWGTFGLIALACGSAASAAYDERAQQIISKTRTTTATYSLYSWGRITRPDENPTEEWAAEFNRWPMHRVETPRVRLVADCAAVMGTYFEVETGKSGTNAQVARAACGISGMKPIRSAEWTGRGKSRFGHVDRLRVTDDDNIRTYDIADNGAIVAGTIADLDGTMRLDSFALNLLSTLPSEDIFSMESLQRSVVPEQYKQRPSRR